jgi:hypothetical protein
MMRVLRFAAINDPSCPLKESFMVEEDISLLRRREQVQTVEQ